jgi:aryl-alcohol dehydrogenase-like predicted oxidoreductase
MAQGEIRMNQKYKGMTRAEFLRAATASALSLALAPGMAANGPRKDENARTPTGSNPMHKRVIPSSGESLPIIGCGTWQTFDVGPNQTERAALKEVLQALFAAGGTVIDSSPMYGRSEQVAGDIVSELQAESQAFIATKVWTQGRSTGIRQMEDSARLLRKERIDLMQIHNLVDWRTHLKTLRDWKAAGRIRYIGITHYTSTAYDQLEALMRSEPLDFVQFNYSLADRHAEQSLLGLAADRGIAVLVNQPFGGGALVRNLSKVPLPTWAREIECENWPQVLLKYVIGHPAVTCAIPGTSRPQHMRENCAAGTGILPDEAMRKRMAAWWDGRR